MLPTPDAAAPLHLQEPLRCAGCGYDLRATTSGRCPECGLRFDLTAAPSAIAWTYRRRIGRIKTYWQTASLACRNPWHLASEIDYPQRLEDARRFRWVTVGLIFLGLLACAIWWQSTLPLLSSLSSPGWMITSNGSFGAPLFPTYADIVSGYMQLIIRSRWWMACMAGGILVFVVLMTGLPSYFYEPPGLPTHRRNRAIALSHYGCASLIWLPATVLIVWPLVSRLTSSEPDHGLLELVTYPILVIGIALGLHISVWCIDQWVLLRGTTACGRVRPLVLCLLVPLVSALAGMLAVVGLYLSLNYAVLLFLSLR